MVREPGAGGAGVLACRYWLHRAGQVPVPVLGLAAWAREKGEWRLQRIYQEAGVPRSLPPDELQAVDAGTGAPAEMDAAAYAGEHPVLSLAVWRRTAGRWSLVWVYDEG